MGLWTNRVLPVIAHILESLHVGATEAEVIKALRAAYPFGPREGHPYKVWCRECKEALRKRFAGRSRGRGPTVVRLVLRRLADHSRLWLDVDCGWCRDLRLSNGCLSCGRLREQVKAAVAEPEFRRLARDAEAAPVLLDWLEENGYDRPEVLTT